MNCVDAKSQEVENSKKSKGYDLKEKPDFLQVGPLLTFLSLLTWKCKGRDLKQKALTQLQEIREDMLKNEKFNEKKMKTFADLLQKGDRQIIDSLLLLKVPETLKLELMELYETQKNKGQSALFGVLEDETIFNDSPVFNESVFRVKLLDEGAMGIDLSYYYHSLKDWADALPKKDRRRKKTAKGWIATARQFMRSDKEKGKLKLVTTIEKKEELREAELRYLNSNF